MDTRIGKIETIGLYFIEQLDYLGIKIDISEFNDNIYHNEEIYMPVKKVPELFDTLKYDVYDGEYLEVLEGKGIEVYYEDGKPVALQGLTSTKIVIIKGD